MSSAISFRNARHEDVERIIALLQSNFSETSLFQQPLREVRRNIPEFALAEDPTGSLIGCAQIHWFPRNIVEILAVAVHFNSQGQGIGNALMTRCIDSVISQNAHLLWLATAKPSYFSRFGFEPMSKWELPLEVLRHKFFLVFQQPVLRWLPALIGRHTFMKLNIDKYRLYATEQENPSDYRDHR
ncbi:MAG: GNAT family N-acetyltransferase [Thermodesulfobacteriota bacterium]|jgi:amino-acid N-acetyltransferase